MPERKRGDEGFVGQLLRAAGGVYIFAGEGQAAYGTTWCFSSETCGPPCSRPYAVGINMNWLYVNGSLLPGRLSGRRPRGRIAGPSILIYRGISILRVSSMQRQKSGPGHRGRRCSRLKLARRATLRSLAHAITYPCRNRIRPGFWGDALLGPALFELTYAAFKAKHNGSRRYGGKGHVFWNLLGAIAGFTSPKKSTPRWADIRVKRNALQEELGDKNLSHA